MKKIVCICIVLLFVVMLLLKPIPGIKVFNNETFLFLSLFWFSMLSIITISLLYKKKASNYSEDDVMYIPTTISTITLLIGYFLLYSVIRGYSGIYCVPLVAIHSLSVVVATIGYIKCEPIIFTESEDPTYVDIF